MSIETNEPAGGQPAGSGNASLPTSGDSPNHTSSDPAKQAALLRRAKLDLLRDALHEALGFAKLYADVAQSLTEVGDDAGTLHALGNFRAAAKVACQAGRDIRELRGEGNAS